MLAAKSDKKEGADKKPVVLKKVKKPRAVGIKQKKPVVGKKAATAKKPAGAKKPTDKKTAPEDKKSTA